MVSRLQEALMEAHRVKDRADVLELIHLLLLPPHYADGLDVYVRQDFRDLAVLPPPSERD